MSIAVLPLRNSPLCTDFLHAAGSVVFDLAQQRRIRRLVGLQMAIGGPAQSRPDKGFDNTPWSQPRRPEGFENFDAREFNKVLHYLRMQMAISRWATPRPTDWFDRTGLHFKQKQRATTRARIAAAYKRVFS